MPHGWNLFKWMDALRIVREDAPDIIHAVQPVEIVGDHRAFAAPILAPAAWVGGQRTAVAGLHPMLQITSRSPGGTAIRDVSFVVGVARDWTFRITNTPSTLGNVVTPSVNDMAPNPTLSLARLGTVPPPPPIGQFPVMHFDPLLLNRAIVDSVYIRPGFTFEMWGNAVNEQFSCAAYFEDFPAQAGTPS